MTVTPEDPEVTTLPADEVASVPTKASKAIKYGSLVALTFFNTTSTLSLRYSQIRGGDIFITSTVIVMTEVTKLVLSLCLVCVGGNLTGVYRALVDRPLDSLKMCVPSLLYVVQNNLLYVGAHHLDAPSFLITCRLKVIATAVFAFFMLKRSFRLLQILSLVLLIAGVALVQLASVTETTVVGVTQNRLIGFAALVTASMFSAFSGTYLEKVLKSTDTSIWMRNVQLSSISLVLSVITCVACDWTPVMDKGFFFGYDWYVLAIILIQAGGGLTVAVVIKYADNIMKCFTSSLSIVVVSLVSVFTFGLKFSWMFAGGVAITIASVFMYQIKFTTDGGGDEDKSSKETKVSTMWVPRYKVKDELSIQR